MDRLVNTLKPCMLASRETYIACKTKAIYISLSISTKTLIKLHHHHHHLNVLIEPIHALRVIKRRRVKNIAVLIHLNFKFPKKRLPHCLHRRRRACTVARNRLCALRQPLDLLLRLRQLLLQLQHLQINQWGVSK